MEYGDKLKKIIRCGTDSKNFNIVNINSWAKEECEQLVEKASQFIPVTLYIVRVITCRRLSSLVM